MLKGLVERLVATPGFRGKDLLMRALLRPLDGQILRSGYGPLLRVEAADATNRFSLRCTSDYDPVFAAVDRLRPGMAFIDIGSNLGLFALVAARRVGPSGAVVAFEPNPPAFSRMVDNLTLNRVGNVFPFELAVGSESGRVSFDPGPRTHSGLAHLDPHGSARVEQIGAAAFNDLVEPLIGRRRAMIKIDVEGAEAVVIASIAALLERPQVEAVIVEVDAANLARFAATPADVYGAMSRLGFQATHGIGTKPHYDEVFRRPAVTGG